MNTRATTILTLLLVALSACGGRLESDLDPSSRANPNPNDNSIASPPIAPKSVGCVADALSTEEIDAVSIAADEHDVFWIVQGTGALPAAIRRRSLDAKGDNSNVGVVDFERSESLQKRAYVLVLDDESVYWTTMDGRLLTKPRGGGTARVLHDALGAYPKTIAIDDDYVYVSTSSNDSAESTLVRIAKSDASTKTLATSKWRIDAVAVHSGWVFWTGGDPLLYKVHRTGGDPVTLSSVPVHAQNIATNGSLIVWTRWMEGTVEGMPVTGGERFELARGRNHPIAISVDSTHATWVDFGTLPTSGHANAPDGAIVRAPLEVNAKLDVLAEKQANPTSAVVVGNAVLYTTRGNFVPGAYASDAESVGTSAVRCVARHD